MRKTILRALGAVSVLAMSGQGVAGPRLQVLGRDFVFPNPIEGPPAKLSDFLGLQINSFTTNDGVKLI